MNKFEKARFNVDLVEAANKAVIDAVWDRLRYDTSYFDYDDPASPEWCNDEWLEAHVNDAGREYLSMAKEIAYRIDRML